VTEDLLPPVHMMGNPNHYCKMLSLLYFDLKGFFVAGKSH